MNSWVPWIFDTALPSPSQYCYFVISNSLKIPQHSSSVCSRRDTLRLSQDLQFTLHSCPIFPILLCPECQSREYAATHKYNYGSCQQVLFKSGHGTAFVFQALRKLASRQAAWNEEVTNSFRVFVCASIVVLVRDKFECESKKAHGALIWLKSDNLETIVPHASRKREISHKFILCGNSFGSFLTRNSPNVQDDFYTPKKSTYCCHFLEIP